MKKKLFSAALTVLVLLNLPACSEKEPVASHSAPLAVYENFETVEGMRIKMSSGNTEVVIILNGSAAAADLAEMLPLELTLIERNGFAKGMTLPQPLDTDEATTREYKIGDFGYWAAGPDLAIFYDDIYERTIVPVIPIGRAESGAENMRNTSGTVRLELMTEKETADEYRIGQSIG